MPSAAKHLSFKFGMILYDISPLTSSTFVVYINRFMLLNVSPSPCQTCHCPVFQPAPVSFCQDDSRISVQLITEECVHKLDTKQQTNALLNLVWRDSASEEVFTMMASICHTLMVQHRLMVPKVRYEYTNQTRLIYLR